MSSRPLYELTKDMKGLESLADSEELDAETIADTMEGIEGEFNDKAVALITVSRRIGEDVDILEIEISRLQARLKTFKNKQESMIEYLRTNMENTGISKISCPVFTITLAKGRDIVSISDADDIPPEYINFETKRTPMKKEILAGLKGGEEIPGASLCKSKTSLRIK